MPKKETTLVCCIDCENAALFRYNDNPIIAACKANDGDGDVATLPKRCALFRQSTRKQEIEQRKYE